MNKLIPLPFETIALRGWTHKLIVDYTDVATWTSGTAQAVVPQNALGVATKTFPAGYRVKNCACQVKTAFVFAPGTLVFTFGDDGNVARLIASLDLKTAAWQEGVIANYPVLYNAANTLDLIVTAGAGALTSVTAGLLEIYLEMEDLNDQELPT